MSDELKPRREPHMDAPDDAWVAYWHTRYTALLDAVREVRDEGYAANALWVIKALTRIIDEHECPPITDIPASVTKPVGTGSGTKAVTMTPDE